MSDLTHDSSYLVYWVTTLSSQSSPTATQIAAGVALHSQMTPSGLTRDSTTAQIDTSKLNSTFTTMAVGRRSFALSATIIRTAADSSGIEAALTYKAAGFLVVRDNLDSGTAIAAAQKVEVYPAQVEQGTKAAPAANELQTITYGFTMTSDATLNATVA